jgi:hypothetical protein
LRLAAARKEILTYLIVNARAAPHAVARLIGAWSSRPWRTEARERASLDPLIPANAGMSGGYARRIASEVSRFQHPELSRPVLVLTPPGRPYP